MSLIYRGDRSYYYHSTRVDGEVVTRYLASGEKALMFASLAEAAKRERRRTKATVRRYAKRLKAAKRASEAACEARRAALEPLR